MSADNNRRIENLIRYGVIAEVNHQKRRARVQTGEILTDWLPWTCVSNCNRSETDQVRNHDPFYDDFLKDYADLSQRDRFKSRNFEHLDDFDDWNFDVFH